MATIIILKKSNTHSFRVPKGCTVLAISLSQRCQITATLYKSDGTSKIHPIVNLRGEVCIDIGDIFRVEISTVSDESTVQYCLR